MGRYIDPRTDFGFKRLFGQEDSKGILKQFLFDMLALPHPIQDLTFIPAEQLPQTSEGRRGIYDVYCVDSMGRRFIVEMQQGHQLNIKERALYYSTFAITYQAQRGADWQFNLLPVYCLVILNFTLVDEDKDYLRRVQLMETSDKTIFYDKLTFVFVELAKFNRPLPEATPADKWIYLLKHMPELQQIPAELVNEPFSQAFAIAEETALSEEERWLYEGSLKQARDMNAKLASAVERGLAEGRAEGRAEEKRAMAHGMLERGVDVTLIKEVTGLSETEIESLQKDAS